MTPWDIFTNGSAINWSSDAYKFAILITDASYKNDNTHSISDMTAMTDLLAAKDIQTSVITSSSCLSIYGRLAMMTGGFTANIDNNFSSLLADYADSVIGTTLPVKEYSVQVLDGVINKPVSGAFRFVGGRQHDHGFKRYCKNNRERKSDLQCFGKSSLIRQQAYGFTVSE